MWAFLNLTAWLEATVTVQKIYIRKIRSESSHINTISWSQSRSKLTGIPRHCFCWTQVCRMVILAVKNKEIAKFVDITTEYSNNTRYLVSYLPRWELPWDPIVISTIFPFFPEKRHFKSQSEVFILSILPNYLPI